MELEIIKAEITQLNQIMEIIGEAQAFLKAQGLDQWQNGYPHRDVICHDINKGEGWAVLADGKLAGYGALVFGTDENYEKITDGSWKHMGAYAAFHRIALAAGYRKAGGAQKLISYFENRCTAAGVYVMRADTHPGNKPMQRFLEKTNYKKRGTIFLAESGEERIGYDKSLK